MMVNSIYFEISNLNGTVMMMILKIIPPKIETEILIEY